MLGEGAYFDLLRAAPHCEGLAIPPLLPYNFNEHLEGHPVQCAITKVNGGPAENAVQYLSNLVWFYGLADAAYSSDEFLGDQITEGERHAILQASHVEAMHRLIGLYELGSDQIHEMITRSRFSHSYPLTLIAIMYRNFLRLNESRGDLSEEHIDMMVNPKRVFGPLLELYVYEYLREYSNARVKFSTREMDLEGVDLDIEAAVKDSYGNKRVRRFFIDVETGELECTWIRGHRGRDLLRVCLGRKHEPWESQGDLLYAGLLNVPDSDDTYSRMSEIEPPWTVLLSDVMLFRKDPVRWPLPRRLGVDAVLSCAGIKDL